MLCPNQVGTDLRNLFVGSRLQGAGEFPRRPNPGFFEIVRKAHDSEQRGDRLAVEDWHRKIRHRYAFFNGTTFAAASPLTIASTCRAQAAIAVRFSSANECL
jgi:hypothetical protein